MRLTLLSYHLSTSINNFLLPISTLPLHWSYPLMYDADETAFYLFTLLAGCAYALAHVVILIGSTV